MARMLNCGLLHIFEQKGVRNVDKNTTVPTYSSPRSRLSI